MPALTATDLRKALRIPGVALVLLNLLFWAFTLIRSPRHVPIEAFFDQSTFSAMTFDQAHCWDCPAFRMQEGSSSATGTPFLLGPF